MKTSKIVFLGATLTLFVLLFGCTEEEPLIVPDVPVNLQINLTLPEFSALNAIGNAVMIKGYAGGVQVGYNNNGIIAYRRLDNSTSEPFFAFDASCPQHIEVSTSVTLDENGFAQTATCPHCSTVYNLENHGYPSSGYALKRYRTSVSGNMLYVTN
jgi:hypothetical protein